MILLAGLLCTPIAACRERTGPCAHAANQEKCLFELGRKRGTTADAKDRGGTSGAGPEGRPGSKDRRDADNIPGARDPIWGSTHRLLDASAAVLERGVIGAPLLRNVSAQCAVEPSGLESDSIRDFECAPSPEIRLGGYDFQLEASSTGVVSLVSVASLEREDADRLIATALEQLVVHCEERFESIVAEDDQVRGKSCVTAAGLVLGVSALSVESESGQRWVVVLSLVSAR